RALCDAQHIGSIDGAAPERAYQDIPPSVVRFVWRREGGRCRVDGCRSARGIEIHHIVHRVDGGTHEPSNLSLLCSSCHAAHHRGALSITGTADHLVVHRPGQPALTEREVAQHASAATPEREPVLPGADRNAHVGARSTVTSEREPVLPGADRNAHVGARSTVTYEREPVLPGADRNAHVGARSTVTSEREPVLPGADRNAHV